MVTSESEPYLFNKGNDPSSGAYLIVEGEADLRMHNLTGTV